MSQELLINGKPWDRYHVTGEVTGASKHLETQVSGGGGGGYSYQGTGSSYSAPVTSRTVTHDQIFLSNGDGKEHALRLQDWDVATRPGHRLTAVWVVRRGKSNGPYVAIRNHTTDDTQYNLDALARMHRPALYLGLAPLLLIGAMPMLALTACAAVMAWRWWTGKSRARALVAEGVLLAGTD